MFDKNSSENNKRHNLQYISNDFSFKFYEFIFNISTYEILQNSPIYLNTFAIYMWLCVFTVLYRWQISNIC